MGFLRSVVKNLVPEQETQQMRVRYLVQEDSLEESMAAHSMPGRSPWTEEPGGL